MAHASELIEKDILGYLKQHEQKDILRFLTCGNVDDGKSTLIGRLLHDSKLIFEDQLAAIKKDSQKFNTTDEEFDLALLVDGLQSEREQGITIDVAYRYFSTDKRKFIIADCPGHEQYTRNMATGASNCDLAVILIDARKGIQTQTKRHSYIVSLLGIKKVVVAINKMDLMDFSESVFEQIKQDYLKFADNLAIEEFHFIPLSALKGDNVVEPSSRTEWYQGDTLINVLETIALDNTDKLDAFRLPVQYVNRPNLDFRGFCGTIASGTVQPGDTVTALPSGKLSTVKAIVTADGELDVAGKGQAVTITLNDEIDVSRGDMLVCGKQAPKVADSIFAEVVWMSEQPMQVGKEYLFKAGTKSAFGRVTQIDHRIDVNTLEQHKTDELQLNEVAKVAISLNQPLVFDAYQDCRGTGSFILIDRISNATMAAGMMESECDSSMQSISDMSYEERLAAFNAEVSLLVKKYFPE
ncbi:sulfate adenylyltransferase subunit CysN [Shewanella corallii]|uniref:Sulfate adenylyltransferase subunit 1 n=1 Tax=Shewanella corallii TaxID=560080 RepID=A0ABT0N7N7_9GAMM|nr:sulfate adenylyltransferase subunit CysN [Shewanella corallii]MCL2914165.1 sulfate adenylyltransferase subunit CysN [Shewanella corallii]